MKPIAKIILKPTTLQKRLKAFRQKRLKIAFTNGCFDFLHLGHIRYLEAAKKNADILVVGLNSDASVRAIKGAHRPVNSQKARASVLAALSCIDFITIFNEATPLKLIQMVKPDILIKGADWKDKGVVGAEFVRSYGGKVKFIKYVEGFSTTVFIEKMKKSV